MKNQIWKFEIKTSKIIVKMPKGAEILTIQAQNGIPCIWALVNPEKEKELRHFDIYGTGQDIHFDMGFELKYINTFQLTEGLLVYHLFERVNAPIVWRSNFTQ